MAGKEERAYCFEEQFDAERIAKSNSCLGEYESCTFSHIDFTGIDCTGARFIDCVFEHCNLSMLRCLQSSFRDVVFRECRLWGFRFDACNSALGLRVRFERCSLRYAVFHGIKIPSTMFCQCDLQEADFSAADLSASSFGQCDLLSAVFDRTVLDKCDFSTAFHFSIHPERNSLRKARFSAEGLPGLLQAYDLVIDDL